MSVHRLKVANITMRSTLRFLLILIIVTSTRSAHAVLLPVTNAGFEDNSVGNPFNEFTFGPPAGWSLYDPVGIAGNAAGPTYFVGTLTPFEADPVGNPGVYAFFPNGAAEGQRVAIAFNFEGSGGQGEYGIEQTLVDTLQPNTNYQLAVEIGNIASGTAMNGQFFPLDGFPGYRVELLAGGVVVAEDNNTLAGSIADGHFGTSVVNLGVGAQHPQLGQPLAIRLVNLNLVDPVYPNSDLEVDFDDVRLDASPLLTGDYNNDGIVDIADYTVWRNNLGASAGTLTNDAVGGVIDADQYIAWRTNFGATLPAEALAATNVPEPNALCLLLSFTLGILLRLPQKISHSFALLLR